MKWTVLVDNRTNNPSLETEHGLSILLETEKHSILLDTGASDVFIRNAERLGKDLSTVDYVFVSHGHSDHAGGLKHFMQINKKAKVIVSPDAISGRFFSKRGNLHSITTEWPEIGDDRLILIDQTREIAKGLHIIAHIPQIHPMPKGNLNLYVQDAHGEYIHDDFRLYGLRSQRTGEHFGRLSLASPYRCRWFPFVRRTRNRGRNKCIGSKTESALSSYTVLHQPLHG